MTTQPTPDLLPCPFCPDGGKPEPLIEEELHHGEPGSTFWYCVRCSECGLRTRREINWNQTVRDRINNQWNTRAQPKVEKCEHCGSTEIYHGPPDCPACGAPNCCRLCCKQSQLTESRAECEKERNFHMANEARLRNERDQSRVECERLREFENALKGSRTLAAMIDERDQLRAQVEELKRYAVHHAACRVRELPNKPCSCGLDQTLKTISGEK